MDDDATGSAPVDRETRQDVAELLVRYATGIDRRDWALFRSCFTDDCVADYGEIGVWHGVDALTEWMERTHAGFGHTLHRITNEAVSARGDGVAARSYVHVIARSPDGRTGVQAHGYYDDEIVRTLTGWKIAHRRYTMVLQSVDAGPPG